MKRCGSPFVTGLMPSTHRPMIAYIEKV